MDEVREDYVLGCLEAFSSIFKNREEIVNYINSLRSAEMAELFCEMGRFYLVSKKHVDIVVLKLTMILTIVEKLQGQGKSFVSPLDFIVQKANFDKSINFPIPSLKDLMQAMRDIKEKYLSEYGATRGVVKFFQDHTTDEEKVTLARSMKTQKLRHPEQCSSKIDDRIVSVAKMEDLGKLGFQFDENQLPSCYEWKTCYIEYGTCHPEIECRLLRDPDHMARTMKKLIQLIYKWRSKFDHEGKIPPISDTTMIAETDDGIIVNDLSIDKFQAIFERTFKRFFDQHTSNP